MIKIGNTKVNPKGLSKVTVGSNVVWTKSGGSHWWDDVSHFTIADIGTIKEVTVNGVTHRVRLIGIDQDQIASDPTKVAHTTWEFADIISDANGYSLATFWKNTNSTSTANNDYLNSDARKAIDGQGSGTTHWFEKDSATWSTTYTEPVINMLPSDLVSKLQTVTKIVNKKTSESWIATSYDTNLFLLTVKGIGYEIPEYEIDTNITYNYYKDTASTNPVRIKAQVMGSTGARTTSLYVTSGAYTSGKWSYAGYNSTTAGNGGYYWLSSPYIVGNGRCAGTTTSGSIDSFECYNTALGVTPCFCLGVADRIPEALKEEYWIKDGVEGSKCGEWTQEFIDSVQTLTESELASTIGWQRKVKVNNVDHLVRVIGYNHDDLSLITNKAKLTFQFSQILSDENGYSIATFWKNTNTTSGSNQHFENSDIRRALDGQGTGIANWFVKGETTWSSSYQYKSVLDMINNDVLKSNLREVTKKVAIGSTYTINNFKAKIFILSTSEMTNTLPTTAKDEGTIYAYWNLHDTATDRVIQQVQGSIGARTSSINVTSGAYTSTKNSWAGYNSSTSGKGSYIWLRSPYITTAILSHYISDGGYTGGLATYSGAIPVAPCFCI